MTPTLTDESDLVVIFSPYTRDMPRTPAEGLSGWSLTWYDCVVRRFQSADSANAEIRRLLKLLESNSRRRHPPELDTLKGWWRLGWNRKCNRLYEDAPVGRTVLISSARTAATRVYQATKFADKGIRFTDKVPNSTTPFAAIVAAHPNPPSKPQPEAHLVFEIIPQWPLPDQFQLDDFPVFEYLQMRSIG